MTSFEYQGIGCRIAAERKKMGMTQGRFAERLGVSPQAVSKWETGQGLPDISLLPQIANVLNISMDALFGAAEVDIAEKGAAGKPESDTEPASAPIGGDNTKHQADTILESDEPCGTHATQLQTTDLVQSREEIRAFADTTDIKGEVLSTGELRYLPDSQAVWDFRKLLICSKYSFYKITVLHDPNQPYGLYTNLTEPLAGILETQFDHDTFKLDFKAHEKVRNGFRFDFNRSLSGDHEKPQITLNCAREELQNLDIFVSGCMCVKTTLPIVHLKVKMSGSSNIEINKAEDAHIFLSGSGDVHITDCNDAIMKISGSGSIDLEQVRHMIDLRMSGAGEVRATGDIEQCRIALSGAAHVHADQLSCETLECSISGPGSVVIGELRGASQTRVQQMGKLRILRRGEGAQSDSTM